MRELEADVRFKLAGGNFVEQMMVELRAAASFFRAADIFAEIVDGNPDPRLIHQASGVQHVFRSGPGDEAAGELSPDRRTLRDGTQRPVAGERGEESSQHGDSSCSCLLGLRKETGVRALEAFTGVLYHKPRIENIFLRPISGPLGFEVHFHRFPGFMAGGSPLPLANRVRGGAG